MTIRRENKKPRGIVAAIAAVEGFGKSTTMAKLPGAYFLDVDEGSFGLDVPCTHEAAQPAIQPAHTVTLRCV